MMKMHKHHIVPRHAGGSDDPSNLLKCNVAMHAFLHKLRYEETGDRYDYIAWQGLEGIKGKEELHRLATKEGLARFRSTAAAKERDRKVSAKMRGNKNGKGRKPTPEDRKRISELMKTRTGENSNRAKRVVTPEGEFISAVEAAKHFGIAHSTAKARARKGIKGWHYKEEDKL